MDISALNETLSSYNSSANMLSLLAHEATKPYAHVLLMIFFALEWDSLSKHQAREGGTVTSEMLFGIGYKYLIAYAFIESSDLIFEAILGFGGGLLKHVDKLLPDKTLETEISLKGLKGVEKALLGLIGMIVEFMVKLSLKIITMMRFTQLYIFRALAPVMTAFFLSETTRSITINFLKLLGAVALQGVLIVLVVRLYPVLFSTELLALAKPSKDLDRVKVALTTIAKGVIFLVILWQTQKQAKNLLNTM